MTQLQFWGIEKQAAPPVVNVAQVPQRSPLRYPGGKTWLVPTVRAWLSSLNARPKTFIEPFAGGGIISLTVAFEDLADQIVMVEIDRDVSALWETMLSDDNDWLAERVLEFDMSRESLSRELATPPLDTKHRAFQTLLRNRTNHGGILAPGSGTLKHGESGRGIRSRWYPQTLYKRIQNVKSVRGKVKFISGDGFAAIEEYAPQETTAFFIDPPYTAGRNGKRAGTRLYTHSDLDHEELFRRVEGTAGNFLMTYDNAREVIELAARHGFTMTTISMKNTHHAAMQELLIGRGLAPTSISA